MKIDPNAPARMTPAQIDAAVEAQRFAYNRDFTTPPELVGLLPPDALRALLAPEAGACKNCNRPKGEHKRGFCVHEFGIGPSSYCAPSNPEKTGLCPHGWAGHCVHCRTGIHATPEVPGSEYDRCIQALAPYLPARANRVQWINGNPWATFLDSTGHTHGIIGLGFWAIPWPPEGDNGTRAIEKGKVTQ